MEVHNNTVGMKQICSHPAEVSVAVAIVVFGPQDDLHLW